MRAGWQTRAGIALGLLIECGADQRTRSGRYVYSTSRINASNSLAEFRVNASTGALATVRRSPDYQQRAVAVAVTPNNKFLYVGRPGGDRRRLRGDIRTGP